jgi:galactofuranosylgalactofuranosylrhamnosyl-N-acetylglucosaminyl-diphospho-decaprenol beta-1,5/1,6-galactofuranosyltransferase
MESQGFLERVLFGALASHNYQEAALVIQAINDFLKGPTLMNEGAELIHEKISVLAREYAPQSVEHVEGLVPVEAKPMPAKRLRITALIAKRITAVMFLGGIGKKRQTRLCMDNQANNATIGNFPYVKTNGPNTYRLLYAPNTVCLMKLLWKGVGALRAYRKNSEVAASKWRHGMNDLRGRERWEQIFQKHNTRQETVNQVNKSGGHASLTLFPANRSGNIWTHQKAS